MKLSDHCRRKADAAEKLLRRAQAICAIEQEKAEFWRSLEAEAREQEALAPRRRGFRAAGWIAIDLMAATVMSMDALSDLLGYA